MDMYYYITCMYTSLLIIIMCFSTIQCVSWCSDCDEHRWSSKATAVHVFMLQRLEYMCVLVIMRTYVHVLFLYAYMRLCVCAVEKILFIYALLFYVYT